MSSSHEGAEVDGFSGSNYSGAVETRKDTDWDRLFCEDLPMQL